jgi:hypothetical protein
MHTRRRKILLAAAAFAIATAVAAPAIAAGASADPNGQPTGFFAWVISLFSNADTDAGLRIDGNG